MKPYILITQLQQMPSEDNNLGSSLVPLNASSPSILKQTFQQIILSLYVLL